MTDTIFGKIINGEVKADFVYEDELCVVINDINPKEKTHLLVIPRKPIASIMEMDESDTELVGHLIYVAKKIADQKGLSGYKLQFNVGKDGGQEVFHLHLHLLSKFA